MSLDELLSNAARHVADGVTPPEVDLSAIRVGARSRQRRTTALVGAGVAAAVAAFVAFSSLVPGSREDTVPPLLPSPSPSVTEGATPGWTPDSITAEEIVTSADARVAAVGVATGDPARRISIWTASSHVAIALTSDGYRSTTYVSAPLGEAGWLVLSPRDDVFLVTDVNHEREWLVGTDGRVRPVTRVPDDVLPEDPRLWYPCTEGDWRYTWCALDPGTAEAYAWPQEWEGSAVPPGDDAFPWGANPEPRSVGSTGQLEAWWDVGGGREVRRLADAEYGDYVLGCPPGLMALWSARPGGVDIHTSRDRGATWQARSYAAPGANQWWALHCAADGAFLAVDTEAGAAVWRAEASGGAFRKVFEAPGGQDSIGQARLWTQHGRVQVFATGAAGTSEDNGKTWTRVRGWR